MVAQRAPRGNLDRRVSDKINPTIATAMKGKLGIAVPNANIALLLMLSATPLLDLVELD
jgi:hypothetical protein